MTLHLVQVGPEISYEDFAMRSWSKLCLLGLKSTITRKYLGKCENGFNPNDVGCALLMPIPRPSQVLTSYVTAPTLRSSIATQDNRVSLPTNQMMMNTDKENGTISGFAPLESCNEASLDNTRSHRLIYSPRLNS